MNMSLTSTVCPFTPMVNPLLQSLPHHADSAHPDGVAEALGDIVLQSPSLLHRIIRIASLWDAASSTYTNPLGVGFDPILVSETLGKLHVEAFTKWLSLSLRAQRGDLALYLNFADRGERSNKLKHLLDSARVSMPDGAIPNERNLFLQDLEIIRALIQDEL